MLNRHRAPLNSRRQRRRGLAPMEFVFALPVLLFTMALMVNFGVIAAWKVRTHTAARQVIWRARSLHSGNLDPNPVDWPRTASISWSGDRGLQTVGKFVNVMPITHPFAHGPVVSGQGHTGQSGYVYMRDRYLLNITDGVGQGTSNIKRPFALLPKMGAFEFTQNHSLLDTRGQFRSMGFGDNFSRRAKGWYIFEEGPAWASAEARFRQADQSIVSYPQAGVLASIDRDIEFRQFYGSHREPDCYAFVRRCPPRAGYLPSKQECGRCILDPQIVLLTIINNPLGGGLVQDIGGRTGGGRGGVPERMANAWIQLYRDEIAFYRGQMPPNQAEIDRLTKEIEKLQEFLTSLS